MIRYFRWLLPSFALVLAACATADLSAFSQQTNALVDSLNGEHQAIATKFNEVVDLTVLAKEEGWFEKPALPSEDGSAEKDVASLAATFDLAVYTKIRDEFVDRSKAISETHNAIASYATALSELAAAGETGEEAVQKSVGTLTRIVQTLGGPAQVIGGPALNLLTEIGDLITRAQAQNRIEESMAVLTGPDGALRKTVQLLEMSLDTLEKQFVEQLYEHAVRLERYRHGPALIAFYNRTNSWAYRNRAFALLNLDDAARAEFIEGSSEVEVFAALRACLNDKPGCPHASMAAGLASRLSLIADIEEKFQAFQAAKANNNEWRSSRLSNIAHTKDALRAWADQHDAIFASLATCGGFKALKPGCGNWSEANLVSAINRFETVFPHSTSSNAPAEGARHE